jgi:hypothetical protein
VLVLTYQRCRSPTGLTFEVEATEDLVEWLPAPGWLELPQTNPDGRTEVVRFHLARPAGQPAPPRLLRLKVTKP